MRAPSPHQCVAVCIGCMDWQVQLAQRAISEHGGLVGAYRAMAEVTDEHWQADHPDASAHGIKLGDGTPATGGVLMVPLPRWWVDK